MSLPLGKACHYLTFVFRARVFVLESMQDLVIGVYHSDPGYHHRVVVCDTRKTARACVAAELRFEKIIKPREQHKVSPRSSKDRNAEITNAKTSRSRPRVVFSALSLRLPNYFYSFGCLEDARSGAASTMQCDGVQAVFCPSAFFVRPPPP